MKKQVSGTAAHKSVMICQFSLPAAYTNSVVRMMVITCPQA